MPDKDKRKVLIVDDDVFISEQLNVILQGLNYFVTGIAFNTQSAIDLLNSNPPDIVLLDIKMHGENQGFEIAKYIKDTLAIPYVFLTSFADEATVKEASKLMPDAYLLKPFSEQDIFSTLNIVLNRYDKKEVHFVEIKKGHQIYKVKLDAILWIKSSDKYIEIHTKERQYLIREGLESFLQNNKLPGLIRTHRSYVINIAQIDSVKGATVYFKNQEIPISKSYQEAFQKAFQAL